MKTLVAREMQPLGNIWVVHFVSVTEGSNGYDHHPFAQTFNPKFLRARLDEILPWLDENIKSKSYKIHAGFIQFDDRTDALLCYMRWC